MPHGVLGSMFAQQCVHWSIDVLGQILVILHKRSGSNPKRRIIPSASFPIGDRTSLALRVQYVGSGHHKRSPADYGLERTNPRPTKSLCDLIRPVSVAEAMRLLETGILRGMVSAIGLDGFPKYVWSVSPDGAVFEAKTHPNTPGKYQGYPLELDDEMRDCVNKMWIERCPELGK